MEQQLMFLLGSAMNKTDDDLILLGLQLGLHTASIWEESTVKDDGFWYKLIIIIHTTK